MRLKKHLLLFLLTLITLTSGWAQTDNDFWFAVPFATPNHDGSAARLVITNADSYMDTIMVVHPFSPVFAPISVILPAQSTGTVSLNAYLRTATNTVNTITSANWTTVDNNSLHIYSKNFARFTCYFENHPNPGSPGSNNPDIWSLKGRNALGVDFWVPFQTQLYNQSFSTFPAYSSFDIIASLPGITVVNITLPAGKADAAGHAAGSTFSISLQQGQTYSVAPKLVTENNSVGTPWTIPSRNPADRLCGSHVTSNQVVAITTHDDSNLKGSAYDMIGDQIVPTINVDGDTLVGREYIVMRGKITNTFAPASNPGTEAIYILATQNGTKVYIRRINGAADSLLATLNAGQQQTYIVPGSASSVYVKGTKPIYTFHVSGFVHEVGGALIPTIDRCTGSQRVAFVRSIGRRNAFCNKVDSNNVFLNIMTKNVAALDSFSIAIGAAAPVPFLSAADFEQVGTTGWWVLKDASKCFSNLLPPGTTIVVSNTVDVFHLGIVNGVSTGGGCRYGYFSNYNSVNPIAITRESGTNLITGCDLDIVQLQAYDSFKDEYQWLTNTSLFLDPTNIPKPRVIPPVGWTDFLCRVRQPCAGYDTLKVTVYKPTTPTTFFSIDNTSGCSPVTVNVKNLSSNAVGYWWDFDDGFTPSTDSMKGYTHTYINKTNAPVIYHIRLTAASKDGCSEYFTIPVTVYPNVIIDSMILSDTIGCHPLPVSFRYKITGPRDRFTWEFGDLASSGDSVPSHTYQNLGMIDSIYNVRLIAQKYNWGDTLFVQTCADTAYAKVTVHPFIQANFTFPDPFNCSPFDLKITNSSLGRVDTVHWTYGDGTFSNRTDSVFTHRYTNPGASVQTNNIKLKVINFAGCKDSLIRPVLVYPQVKAIFNAPDSVGCNPFTATFTNTSTNATYYSWEFGDGSGYQKKDTTHQFHNFSNADTTFTVQLVALSEDDLCSDTAKHTVTVHSFLDAAFTLSIPQLCAPDSAIFLNSSRGGITQTTWDFGDASGLSHLTDKRIAHFYHNTTTDSLTRTIRLEIENSGGCTKSVQRKLLLYPEMDANFNMNVSQGCNPLRIAFTNTSTPIVAKFIQWDFNDGTSTDTLNPVHWFRNTSASDRNYNIKLRAISKFNCVDSISKQVTVYPFIEADFTLDSYEGCTPFTVNITNTSRGGVVWSDWNYNDGTLSADTNHIHSHTYYTDGDHYITLKVQNKNLCTDTISRAVKIHPGVNASFTVDKNYGCQPLKVTFTNLSGPGSTPDRYDWDFGDGTSLTSFVKTPAIPLSKMYMVNYNPKALEDTVRLIASSQNYCRDTAEVIIRIFPYITAAFSMDPANKGCSPLEILFANNTSQFNVAQHAYRWDFGDGMKLGAINNYSKTYTWNGVGAKSFYPKITAWYNDPVTGLNFCHDSTTQEVIVYPAVTAIFKADTLQGCNPLTVYFTESSLNADFTRSRWTFGDGGTGISSKTGQTLYTYYTGEIVAQKDTVILISTSAYNCKDTTQQIVTVYPTPQPLFTVDPSVGCPKLLVNIDNTSLAGDTCFWDFGDGTDTITQNIPALHHTFENLLPSNVKYLIKMRLLSQFNCEAQNSAPIQVYTHVYADFVPKDTASCNPTIVTFTNKTVGATNFTWYFGNEATTTVVDKAYHEFHSPAIVDTAYQVTLIARSTQFCADTAVTNVYVYPQPKTEFILSPSHLYYPDAEVVLRNKTNDGYFDYLWNFKDGQTSTDRDPVSHIYAHWGYYRIFLSASNQRCSDTVSHLLKIFPPVPMPEFSQPVPGCMPHTVQFTDQSIWATSWLWEFDDGGTSTEQNPSHTFLKPGRYNIKMTASGDGGSAYIYHDIEVYPVPTAQFSLYPPVAMLPSATVQYYNTSLLGTTYLWDFGDGQQSNEFEPNHQYANLGEYDVSLSVWTNMGCFDSLLVRKAVQVVGEGGIKFPNAFTPNKDAPVAGTYSTPDLLNEVFHPYWKGVETFHLEIFNRWGEKLFESDDVNVGWNGYYKGKLCKTDVYVWYAKGTYTNGKSFNLAGNVTLLR